MYNACELCHRHQPVIQVYYRFVEGPPGIILAEQFACKARLVLHFDINKTIIMTDKAQESDMDQMLNMLLSECAWGRLEPGPTWVPVGRLATDRYAMQRS